MDVGGSEGLNAEEQSAKEEITERLEVDALGETRAKETAPGSLSDALPEHIKVETLSFIIHFHNFRQTFQMMIN